MHRIEGYRSAQIASGSRRVSAVEKHIARAVLALMGVWKEKNTVRPEPASPPTRDPRGSGSVGRPTARLR